MKRYLVFDLDGTLVDSLPGIAEGVGRALAALQLPVPSPEQVRGMIGQGARNLCAQALGYDAVEAAPAQLLEEMYRLFCQEYPRCWQGAYTRPYAGIPELLETLAAAGARLGVLSNKPHAVTHPMVQELFSQVPFEPIMGYTGQFPRKPAPDALRYIATQWGVDPAELVLVGDSLFDARTAENAGSGLQLVAWGYARVAELEASGHALAYSVAELTESLMS